MLHFSLNDQLTSRKLKDDYFVFDRTSGVVHMFNDTGSTFWEHLSSGLQFNAIVDAVVEEYEITSKQVTEDLFMFIQQLAEKKLVTLQE